MTRNELGMYSWGGITGFLALACLVLMISAALYMDKSGSLQGAPSHIAGLYQVLKDNGSLLAGILGFSGLAWAHFYKSGGKTGDNDVKTRAAESSADACVIEVEPRLPDADRVVKSDGPQAPAA